MTARMNDQILEPDRPFCKMQTNQTSLSYQASFVLLFGRPNPRRINTKACMYASTEPTTRATRLGMHNCTCVFPYSNLHDLFHVPPKTKNVTKSTTKIVNAILQLMTRVGVPSRVYSFFEVLGSYYALLIKGDDGRLPCQLICLSLKHTTKRTDYTTLSGHMCTLCFRQHCSHCITPIKIFC